MTTSEIAAIDEMNETRSSFLAARDHYIATGEGGNQVFYGVTVKLSALYFLMKQAEKKYEIEDTDQSFRDFENAQKNYYRAGGTSK